MLMGDISLEGKTDIIFIEEDAIEGGDLNF